MGVDGKEERDVEEGSHPVPPTNLSKLPKKLSFLSAKYDVNGDGVLDETEQKMREMDVKGEGHISNAKVYQLLHEQKNLYQKVFGMRRMMLGLLFFTVILALSNLATAWAAAVLAKDTSVQDGKLVERTDSNQVIATKNNVAQHTASSSPLANDRRQRRQLSQYAATTTTIPKSDVEAIHGDCASTAHTITRTLFNEGEHTITIGPSCSTSKSGSTYQFQASSGAALDVDCSSSDTCIMTGDALKLPYGLECTSDTDCASNECILSVCHQEANRYFYWKDATGDGSGRSIDNAFTDLGAAIAVLGEGDTLKIKGEVTNESYDDSYAFQTIRDDQLWHSENSISINNVHGTKGRFITFEAYQSSAVIKGDGANILRIRNSSYLRIIGLEIQGEVDNIPLATALAVQFVYKDEDGKYQRRVREGIADDPEKIASKTFDILSDDISRPSYTSTRGIYVSDSDHIVIQKCHVHHAPGTGLRVAGSEYVDVIGNKVHDNSRRSYAGTHGLVPTKTYDNLKGDPAGEYRLRVVGNEVYNNYNEIYSWAPSKNIITPHIDEGKGISLQRNQHFTDGGRILVANNLAYENGFSGVHANDSDNVDFIGNTAYLNSYTNSITYNKAETGMNVGISISGGTGNRIVNNIVVVDSDIQGIPYSIQSSGDVEFASHNLAYGIGDDSTKTMRRDSDFDAVMDADTFIWDTDPVLKENFRLRATSPVANYGDSSFAQITGTDLLGVPRDETPSLGCYERT